MTVMQILFLVTGVVVLGSALMVVTTRNLVHAALWLIVTLFGVAVLYAILNAGFLAVVQVVIYIGAIAILFIFAVMLTRKELRDKGPQLNPGWWLGASLSVFTFGGLIWMLQSWTGFLKVAADLPAGYDAVAQLGNALVSPDAFVLPFEAASVLLLAALVGAVYVAFTRSK
jgi:NADH-quinone oxidoreductase subunit J